MVGCIASRIQQCVNKQINSADQRALSPPKCLVASQHQPRPRPPQGPRQHLPSSMAGCRAISSGNRTKPDSIIVLGTGVQDTMCAGALQHAIATMRPGTAQKRNPSSNAGYMCFHAPSINMGADQTGRPRKCDPLASVAQAQRKLPKCKIPSPSCSQSQRSCRIGVAPMTDVISYPAAVSFRVLQAALCHLGCRNADFLVNCGR